MEKIGERGRMMPRVFAVVALGLSALALTGCPGGQTTVPTTEQVTDNMKVFEYPDVLAANGEPLRCVLYGSQSEHTNVSKSWFGFSCDFTGEATFPGEVASK